MCWAACRSPWPPTAPLQPPLLPAHSSTPSPPAARQVFNVCTSPIVQQAWNAGQPVAVHGLVYALYDGILKVGVGL